MSYIRVVKEITVQNTDANNVEVIGWMSSRSSPALVLVIASLFGLLPSLDCSEPAVTRNIGREEKRVIREGQLSFCFSPHCSAVNGTSLKQRSINVQVQSDSIIFPFYRLTLDLSPPTVPTQEEMSSLTPESSPE